MVLNELLENINRIHTTELGIERIKRNLSLDTDNVVEYCVNILKNEKYEVEKKVKIFMLSMKTLHLQLMLQVLQ